MKGISTLVLETLFYYKLSLWTIALKVHGQPTNKQYMFCLSMSPMNRSLVTLVYL